VNIWTENFQTSDLTLFASEFKILFWQCGQLYECGENSKNAVESISQNIHLRELPLVQEQVVQIITRDSYP